MGIEIGSIRIPWYGLFTVLGITAAMLLGYFLMRAAQMNYEDFIQIACFVGLGAMIGAKLLYLIISWKNIDFSRITDLEYVNMLMGGGFVFYGGVIGGLAGLYLCGKLLHLPVFDYAQAAMPVIPLAHAFGRIGCAFVGCCYGIPYEGPGAVVYTESAAAPLYTPLFPVQAVEVAGELLVTVALCLYIMQCRKEGKKLKSVELYLILYSVLRFALEFLRYDDIERGILLGLSISQWISIVIGAAAAGKMICRRSAD